MATLGLNKLRQKGEEEQRGFRVEEVDQETLAENASATARLVCAVKIGNARGTEKLLEAQPNQVGRAGIFHHAEGNRGRRQERRQPPAAAATCTSVAA